MRTLVWTSSGFGHWKEMIIITGETDCYCCRIKLFYATTIIIDIPDTRLHLVYGIHSADALLHIQGALLHIQE